MILGLQSVTRRRYATGSRGADGRWSAGSSTDTTIELSLQPLSGHELASLPEGERAGTQIKAYGATTGLVRTLDEEASEAADRIIVASGAYAGTYEARAFSGQPSLIPHTKVRLVKLLEADG